MEAVDKDLILKSFMIKLKEDIKYHFNMRDPEGLFNVLSNSVDLVQDRFMYPQENVQDNRYYKENSASRLGLGMLENGILHQSVQFRGDRVEKDVPLVLGTNVVTTSAIILKHKMYIEDTSNRPKYER